MNLHLSNNARYLYKICVAADGTYWAHLCFINMPVWKKFKQVFESENLQFFFQKIGPLWPDAF